MRIIGAIARGRVVAPALGAVMSAVTSAALGATMGAAMGAVLAATPAAAEPYRYVIDPAHAYVGFAVDHVGYARVRGFFREVGGAFTLDEDARALSDVSIEVKLASVDTNNEARDEHLLSPDFLDAEAHPTMTFVADGIDWIDDKSGRVTGELTLRGVTRPLTLDAVLNRSAPYPFGHGGHVVGVSASGSLKRSDFGSDYAVENGWVGDEVAITIEFEAVRQAEPE